MAHHEAAVVAGMLESSPVAHRTSRIWTMAAERRALRLESTEVSKLTLDGSHVRKANPPQLTIDGAITR